MRVPDLRSLRIPGGVARRHVPSDLAFPCGSVTRAGTVTVPYSIVNLEQGAPILVCTNLRESIEGAWPRLKNFS
jgi:hypothetical protein